jgi:hypothetical protein
MTSLPKLLADAVQPAAPGPAAKIPFGVLPYTRLRTDPTLGFSGSRPFGPGEFMTNPNGSWSSEMSSTVQFPDQSWGVVPGLWLDNGKPTHVDEDEAARRALEFEQRSGNQFQRFPDVNAAEAYSNQREDMWQGVEPGARLPTLYGRK